MNGRTKSKGQADVTLQKASAIISHGAIALLFIVTPMASKNNNNNTLLSCSNNAAMFTLIQKSTPNAPNVVNRTNLLLVGLMVNSLSIIN